MACVEKLPSIPVDSYGLSALPLFVVGTAINELLLAVKRQDEILIPVVVVTLCAGLLASSRTYVKDHRIFYFCLLAVTLVASLLTIMLTILAMSRTVINEDTLTVSANSTEGANSTSCNQNSVLSTSLVCYETWVEDIKSSCALCVGNLFITCNLLFCKRKIFSPVSQSVENGIVI